MPERRPRLRVDADPRTDLLVLALAGELDVDSVGVLRAAVAAGPPAVPLVLDLGELMFIDSNGLSALVELTRACQTPPERPFALVRGRPALHRVFELSGLDTGLRFVESPEDVT